MISIVIPLYNEGPNLDQLHGRLTGAGESWEEDYEILLVDDGSTDGSTASMRRIVDCDPRFRLLRLSRNFGHQAAISAGIRSQRV